MQELKKGVVINSSIINIIEFIRNPTAVGSIFSSSNFLAKKVASEVRGKIIVELGPGTGKVTREILKRLPPDGKLICIESENRYCSYLKRKFAKEIYNQKLFIIRDSAEHFKDYVNPDCVVSGLPLTSLHKFLVHRVLSESSKVQKYIQYQYYPFSKKRLKRYFKNIKIKHEIFNIVPSTIYVCSNPKDDLRY